MAFLGFVGAYIIERNLRFTDIFAIIILFGTCAIFIIGYFFYKMNKRERFVSIRAIKLLDVFY